MLVNNINISNFSAELIDREITTDNLKTITEWLDQSPEGIVLEQIKDFKQISLTFLVSCASEDEAYKNIAQLTAALKLCLIKFDDIDLTFNCSLNGAATPMRKANGVFTIKYVLKNDKSTGEPTTVSFNIPTINNFKLITIEYVDNWKTAMGAYTDCFDDNDFYKTIITTQQYLDMSIVGAAAASVNNWTDFFLTVGFNLNEYKPIANNTDNGTIDTPYTEYSAQLALDFINNNKYYQIIYNRFDKDGIEHFPKDVYFPSLICASQRNYGFQAPGQGNVLMYGRIWQSSFDGIVLGTGLNIDDTNILSINPSEYTEKVALIYFNTTFHGYDKTTQLSNTPIGAYGIQSSGNMASCIFDNSIIGQTTGTASGDYITIFCGSGGTASGGADFARLQVSDPLTGEITHDYIPITGNLKNGLVNTSGLGLYDTITLRFYPWLNPSGQSGDEIPVIMDIPTPSNG